MCLAKYLYHDEEKRQPKWCVYFHLSSISLELNYLFPLLRVRASYITPTRRLPKAFLDSHEPPAKATATKPPIIHITPESYKPSLSKDEIKRIDNMVNMAKWTPAPDSMKYQVTSEAEPETNKSWMRGDATVMRECAYCRECKEDMPQCSR